MSCTRIYRCTRRLTWFVVAALLWPTISRSDTVNLPSLGDASSRIISPQLERRIGEGFLQQLHAAYPTSPDPLIKYWVEKHITALAQHSELRKAILSVAVIDDDTINAFAAPGGVVGINLGLLLHAQDVHEYSSVVAHELAHLSQRHFARGVEEAQAGTLPALATLIGALLIGVMGGGEAGLAAVSAAQAASHSRQMRFSREREQEADRIGLNTLVRADLDPSGMSRMFERMQRAFRFTRKPPEFVLTHPLSETRIADARNQALQYRGETFPDSLDYHMMRIRAQLSYEQNPTASIKTFQNRLRDQPDDVSAQYGLALALSKNEEHQEALLLIETVHNINPSSILYTAAHAELLIAADENDLAQRILSHQLVLNPDNTPLSLVYADSLNAQGKHTDAEAILERQSKKRPDDVDVWYELAETAGLAGNITGVHLARAEYFYLHGAYHRSIQHLEYAQRLVRRTNPQLLAKLTQRIQDLRTAVRMQNS
jgi:predicted Zn-dependent protease